MKKALFRRSLVVGAAIFALIAVTPAITFAQEEQPKETTQEVQKEVRTEARDAVQERRADAEERRKEIQAQSAERREQGQARLEEAKLKACQNREKVIQNIMARMADRGTKQLDVISNISERVQTFYVDQGNTLANYDALVAEVIAKEEAAQTAVDTVKNSSDDFVCDGDDPRAVADGFKVDAQVMREALKEYKTAVKDLVAGVKSVQPTTEGGQ